MKFNVAIVDPPHFPYTHFLHDAARYILHGLEELGHVCILTRLRNPMSLEPGWLPIIVNGHTLTRGGAQLGARWLSQCGPYVVLQSELVGGPGTESNLTELELEQYAGLLAGAAQVWDGLPANVAYLRRLGVDARLLRIGYSRALEDVRPKREKDIDFLFYGSMGRHRIELLNALHGMGFHVYAVFDTPAHFRNDLIARSRIVLAMKHSDTMTHLPFYRVVYAVNNRALVVAEECDDQEWLEPCFVSAPTESFVDKCCSTLADELQGRALGQVKYLNLLTLPHMAEYLRPLVDSLPCVPQASKS